MNTISIGKRPLGEAQNKAIRIYVQSRQDHMITEIRDSSS